MSSQNFLPNIPPSSLCTTYPYTRPTLTRRLYYKTDPNQTPYLHFTNVPPTLITQSLEQDQFLLTKARITYDYPSRTLIMKGHPQRQELAKGLFDNDFLMFRYTLEKFALRPLGATTVAEGDVVKEPDLSWRPRDLPPGRARIWPSLVLHVGWPEGLEYLRGEAKLWLEWSKGDVRAVVLMDVGREELGIEKWVMGDEGGRLDHRVEVKRKKEGVVEVLGGPFVVTFREAFLRDPDPEKPLERDWVWGGEEIKECMGCLVDGRG